MRNPPLLSSWTWKMAWRDSRTGRGKLLLFSFSIVLGVAALTAIGSLRRNLQDAIEQQAKSLLGADLVINSRDAFTPEQELWLQGLGGQQSREVSFASMLYLPRTGSTRLVQVRALGGGFPFYGGMEADPPAAANFRRSGGALVEDSLLRQYQATAGDELKIGKLTTRIAGALRKVPGETIAMSAIAPRVYISLEDLPKTGLLQEASLARYRTYFKFDAGVDVPKLITRIQPELKKFRFSASTVEERKRELGRSLENLYGFLNLAGFVALLLGGVGVASAIFVHVKQKLGTVAILRCLGASISQTFWVYLAQGIALGLIGTMLGAGLGVAIQGALPRVLADFIPFDYQFHVMWLPVARAALTGFVICFLFALLPLLSVRRVSPLAVLRSSVESESKRRDPWRWATGACLGLCVFGFAMTQSQNRWVGLWFAIGVGVAFAALAITAKLLIWTTRWCVPHQFPYTVRQGIANLNRPNNRTLLVLLALGLGTFQMTTMYLVQHSLLREFIVGTGPRQPNAVLFDIQGAQLQQVTKIVQSEHLPILDETPLISMRLSSVKGNAVDQILGNTNRTRGHTWAYRREYRSTYSDHLRDGEKIVAGKWIPQVTNAAESIPISLEQGIARDLHVGLGDELGFDVQGVPISTRIASLREVEWRRIQPNFFVVFPRGVLESAPAMHVIVTHVASADQSARLQREVIQEFPNVSAIDLTLVVQSIDSILRKIAFVIRFLAMFTVATGVLVMITALLTSRYQRLQECVLLRALGASRGQILRILGIEYCCLGLLAGLTGTLLATLAAWALARFVFHTGFTPAAAGILVPLLSVPALTLITGFLISRGALKQPPLSMLRSE
ncbi:MAG TPA: FtsX-like permease family protein [Verrucomicrobiae bacterium]|nr:FtsX-like permease family protein [Verrucomicrobiae bacterium]